MIKLVVFDWNGTLFSDVAAATHGANSRMIQLGRSPLTTREYQEAFEMPIAKTYANLGFDPKLIEEKAHELSVAFHLAYEERAKHVRTRRGTRYLLDYLSEQGIAKIIFSNHTAAGIDFQLKRLKIGHYFETVLANEDILGAHFKGKKDRLVAYLQTARLNPREIVIIGDTIEEIEIGKELGLKTVAITGGFCTVKRLRTAKPDVLIHHLRDLIKIIEEA